MAMTAQIIEAHDCLATLRDLPSDSVDAVITDPPYSSGGMTRSDRMNDTTAKYVQSGVAVQRPDFQGDNRDQRSFQYWCSLWLSECLRIVKPGGVVCVFTDWRQLPITTDAVQAGGWIWRGIVPWDKINTRPQMGRFGAQAEYIVWGSRGPLARRENVGCLPGLIRQAVKQADKFHITGKPSELMRQVNRICEPGGIILDPFCGSGSTGVAAVLDGFSFIGIERDAHYAEVARNRVAEAESRLTLGAA